MTDQKPVVERYMILCPKLRKEVSVDARDIYVYTTSRDCEHCGSHGRVELSFSCECGEDHSITIKEW